MGEYAKRLSDGQDVKIGTCESMYYLRYDQRQKVGAQRGNVDPNSLDALNIRFRFPFPDEDQVEPGEFENYGRSIQVPGYAAAKDVDHGLVQFSAQAGYLVSLPCPEGPSSHGFKVHRNGFSGAVKMAQQKLLADGRVVPILECGGCGSAWRVEDDAEIQAIAVAFRGEADRKQHQHNIGPYAKEPNHDSGAGYFHKIADRILAGAGIPTTEEK